MRNRQFLNIKWWSWWSWLSWWSWYINLNILLFINIFPRAQKRNRFFEPTSGCWDKFFIQSKLKMILKKETNSCSGCFSFFLLNTPINLKHDGCINRKKRKISPSRSWKGSQLLFWLIFLFFYWYNHHELDWLVFQ